ncbi:hypothetical protein [Acidovorax sp. Root402]|uniref:hypothetical protein n=1 Tax=Acidovorax sp. Root402 TaxID=1736527 RepID=UPI0006F41B60|nr:hypothetical protein [Acidovorax sp. Root402]KQW24672.1 hypothetical protein ASC83_10975 [Acidovorax sp. Root402]
MSALGSLVVKLGLDYAQYTGGLDKSEQAALAASKKIQDTFDNMKAKVAATAGAIAGGLAAGFTIAAFKGLISGAIEGGAALDDLRMQTGATVEALSGLMAVGKFNNMGPEQIGAAMNKLAANLAGASEESKGTGKALEALGIDFDSFKKLRPEEQMLTVAKAMAKFEDGTGKAAVAMAFYGKQGAQMLPFLHDLAEVETLAAKVTTEQAAAAANLDDNLTRLSTSGEAWKKELANGMIPALDLGAQAMLDVMNGSGGIREEVRRLVADGSVQAWTKSAITGLTYVADAAQYVMRGVKLLAESLGAYAAAGAAYFGGVGEAVAKVLRGDFTGALDSMRSGTTRAGTIIRELGTTAIQTFGEDTLGSRIRARMGEIEATGGQVKEVRKALEYVNTTIDKTGKAAAAAKNPVDALLESIDKRVAVLKEELSAGEKLTEGEKMAAEVRQKLATSTDAQIVAGRSLVETKLKDMLTTEQQVVAHREELKSLEATREARMKLVQGMEQATSSLVAQNQALREEIEVIGLTDAAQLQLLQSRNSALILTKEATLAELERASVITGTMTREQIALQAEIEALRERNELLGAKYDRTITAKAATEAANEWTKFYDSIYNGLSDSLYRGFEAGKGFFKSFWDGIKNLFKTTVLKLAVQGVMTGITGALGLTVTGANAGVTGGAGGGGGLGMLSGLGNIVSSGFDLITKGVSSAVNNAFGNFASSDLGVRLGLSTPVDYGTGYTANVMTPMGSNIGAGLGMLGNGLAGYGISSMLSGGYSVGGGNAVNIIAGIASAFFGPLAGVVGGLINRLFGRKLADVGIEGTFGGKTGFEGQQYEFYKGGLFRSDKTKYSDLDPAFEKALGDTFKGMRAQVAYFADTLGLSADKLEGYTSKIKISTQGLNAEQIQQKFQEALATANNELAEQVLGTWTTTSKEVTRVVYDNLGRGADDFMASSREVTEIIEETTYTASKYAKEGEKAIDTLTRLSTSLTTVNGIFDTLGYTLLEASLDGADAASKIADAFGGLDKMVAATSSYFQNFYSEEERRAVAVRQLDGEFAKLGLTVPKTRAEYRRLVEAQDLNTEAGRKAYAMLIMLSGSFAELNQTAEEAAAAAKDALRTQLDAAYSTLERSIAAQRKALEAQRAAAAELAGLWGKVQDIASGAMRELRGEVGSTAAQQAAQGMVFIENAVQGALLGIIPNADDLTNALSAARGGLTADNYLTQFELDRDRLVLAGQMEQLAGVAGKQKSIAEQSLDALDRQIKQGEETLEKFRELIDIATGNVQATVSVEEAINQLTELLKPKTPGAGGSGGSGSAGGAGFGPGMPGSGASAADAKYKRVLSLGTAGIGYEPVIDQQQIAKLDALAPVYHKFDGTGDLKGLLEAVKSAGGTLNDLALITGFFDADWAKAAASVGVPAFRLGGDHRGGWAMVGEDGPELAYLPPARIYTASTTRRMLADSAESGTTSSTAAPVASTGESKTEALLARVAQVLEDSFEGNGLRTIPA